MRLALLPGFAKARLRSDIGELRRIALEFGGAHLSGRRAALWAACCEGATDTVTQLFVQNSDKRLDWGLRRYRKRLNGQRLAAIYWWMLLYQLTLFRNRGMDGYDKVEDFEALREAAEAFMGELVRLPHIGALYPGHWHEHWERQVALEAAMDMYNGVMGIMGIDINREARVMRVSLFTSATEHAYETVTKRAATGDGG